jgi:hypothetical protein
MVFHLPSWLDLPINIAGKVLTLIAGTPSINRDHSCLPPAVSHSAA